MLGVFRVVSLIAEREAEIHPHPHQARTTRSKSLVDLFVWDISGR